MAVDPHRQFASPYLGMGNNWMNGVDRDGRDWYLNGDGKIVNLVGVTGTVDGYDFVMGDAISYELNNVTITPNPIAQAVRAGQNGFVDNSLTRSMSVFTAHLLSGPGGWAAYGKSLAFNLASGKDWQQSVSGVDAAGLLIGKIPGEGLKYDGIRNTLNNFIDYNGESGFGIKGIYSNLNGFGYDGQTVRNTFGKSVLHTTMDGISTLQKPVLGEQISRQTNDIAKRIMGSDGFDE